MPRIAIIGGGLSGLSTAYELTRRGHPDFVLYEATSRLGGIVETHREDGFIIECGADSWVTEKPWARELAIELGLEDEIIPSNDAHRRTYLLDDGKLIANARRHEDDGAHRPQIDRYLAALQRERPASLPRRTLPRRGAESLRSRTRRPARTSPSPALFKDTLAKKSPKRSPGHCSLASLAETFASSALRRSWQISSKWSANTAA